MAKLRLPRNKIPTSEIQACNRVAVLIFDDETETTNIFLANDPILQKLDRPGIK